MWRARHSRPAALLRQELQDVEAELDRLGVPYEEWEVLFRELLLVDRALHAATRSVAAWAPAIGEVVATAVPHVVRLAESVDAATEPALAGRNAPRNRRTLIAVATAILASVGMLLTRRRARTAESSATSRARSRRPAA
jgi:hypothetical protein